MKIVAAVAISVLISLGIGYWIANARLESVRQEMVAGRARTDQQIAQLGMLLAPKTVTGSTHVMDKGAGTCKSMTTGTIRMAVGDTVEWTVGDFANCLRGGWNLEFRFADPTYVDPPLPTGTLPPTESKVVIRAKALKAGTATYKVWRVRRVGSQTFQQELEDPELEIVQTFALTR